MSLVIDLAPEIEKRLETEAKEAGIDPPIYAGRLIASGLDWKPKTGAELVEYLNSVGVIGAWADRTDIRDSSSYARDLRTRAETRSHEVDEAG